MSEYQLAFGREVNCLGPGKFGLAVYAGKDSMAGAFIGLNDNWHVFIQREALDDDLCRHTRRKFLQNRKSRIPSRAW